ncbi:MAG TPA: 2OG-Fe(II) oxygenase family protein [Gammaproteobacteria bacterium]|nr:2OG-Fe(II) oxygenase family protein [Gammaproteobacteria bacterium]
MLTNNTANARDVIDMKHPDYMQQLFASLLSNRYFILKNHPIELSNLDILYQEWAEFFTSDNELKHSYLYSSETDDGYVPINLEHAKDINEPDLKEFYQIHFENLYKQKNACSSGSKKLFEDLATLGESLIKVIDEMLPKEIKKSMAAPLWLSTEGSKRHCMRFIHYPPCGDADNSYRSAPHDDICLLTIIIPACGEGLMMEKNKGWQKENAEMNSLVVFNSEMLEIATDGYLKSMRHHVTTDLVNNARVASRYSMPFFVHPHSNMFLNRKLTSYTAVRQRIIDTGLDKIK